MKRKWSLGDSEMMSAFSTCPHCGKKLDILIPKEAVKLMHKTFKTGNFKHAKKAPILVLKLGEYEEAIKILEAQK